MPAARKAFHKWTTHDRELLCLLKTRLSREGFEDGVSAPSLDAQYQEMKTGGGGHEIYARIASLSDDEIKNEHRAHLRDIEQAIRSLRLKVQPSSSIAKRPTQYQQNKPQKKKIRRVNRFQESERSDVLAEPEPLQSLVRPELQPFMHHRTPCFPSKEHANTGTDNSAPRIAFSDNDTIAPALRISTDFNGNAAPARPLLLFRATPNVNNFRSRKHADPFVRIPPPPQAASKEYRDISRPHLERDKSYPSPFISLAQNPRNAIRRIEFATSEHVDQKMFLAVFAFNNIEADSTQAFGPASGPQLVRSLFSAKEISDLPDGYKGSGEWLVYGRIDCEPICVLDAVQAVKLAKALRKYKGGDLGALSAISENVQTVPFKWREAMAYVLFRYYCGQSHVPEVASRAYRQLMDIVVHGTLGPTAELVDFSRLSVADNGSDYEDESTENSATPHQPLIIQPKISCAAQSIPVTASTKPVSPSIERVKSVIGNLNNLASRPPLREIPQDAFETTPFWSPDPSEDVGTVPATGQSPQNQPRALPIREAVSLENVDDDDDWELVNDDLEQSFVKSFPSASRRVEHLQSAHTLQASPEIDFGEEDEGYIVPSIEKDQLCNDENLYGRGNFLHGLSQHAVSMTPPMQETPTKLPRNSISSRILKPCDDNVTSGITGQQAIATTLKFTPYQAYVNRKTTQIQNPVSERPGLARIISLNGHGSENTIMNRNTSTSNLNGWPKTNIRTKVPVIVRKKIVDY